MPWDHDILKESYDGLFVSEWAWIRMAGKTVENLRALLDGRPLPEAPIFEYAWGTNSWNCYGGEHVQDEVWKQRPECARSQ